MSYTKIWGFCDAMLCVTNTPHHGELDTFSVTKNFQAKLMYKRKNISEEISLDRF